MFPASEHVMHGDPRIEPIEGGFLVDMIR